MISPASSRHGVRDRSRIFPKTFKDGIRATSKARVLSERALSCPGNALWTHDIFIQVVFFRVRRTVNLGKSQWNS